MLLRNVVIDDCNDDELYFIIHLLLYGTKIILSDINIAEIDHLDKKQNLIKDIALFAEKLSKKELHQVDDSLRLLKTLLFHPHKIVPKLGEFSILNNTNFSEDEQANQNINQSEDDIGLSVWKLHPVVVNRLLQEFYLERELVVEASIYASVLNGNYNINRTRTVSAYAQFLELSASQLATIESRVFHRLHEKGIEIQLQNHDIHQVRKSDERSEIIAVLGDSVHENIFWEGDESEFILMDSDSETSLSDSSSLMIRRRNVPIIPNPTRSSTLLGQAENINISQNMTQTEVANYKNANLSSRKNPAIAALWESDSEIILRCESLTSTIPKTKSIESNTLHASTTKSSNNSVSVEDKEVQVEDDETDLFER